MRAYPSIAGMEIVIKLLTDDVEAFTRTSSSLHAYEKSMILSRAGLRVGCDARVAEQEGEGTSTLKVDGAFAKEEFLFGEVGREVLFQNLKRVYNEVGKSI